MFYEKSQLKKNAIKKTALHIQDGLKILIKNYFLIISLEEYSTPNPVTFTT